MNSSFIPFTNANGIGHSGPLNTQRRRFPTVSDRKLRYAKVSFVSGGGLEPAIFTDPEKALASMSLGEAPEPNPQQEVAPLESTQPQEIASDQLDHATISPQDSYALPFVIDTLGSGYVPAGFQSPRVQPVLSDSSDEVIVFTGRNRLRGSPSKESPISKEPIKPDETQRTTADNSLASNLLSITNLGTSQDASLLVQQDSAQGVTIPLATKREPRVHYSQIRSHRLEEAFSEQALINDYIVNIVDQGLNPEIPLSQRDLGEAGNNDWLEINNNRECHKKSLMSCRNPSKLYNFDDISTSDEAPRSPQAILSKRKRQSGLQYLVVQENYSMGGARWIPKSSLTDSISSRLIEEFEVEKKMAVRYSNCDESINVSISSEDSSDNDIEDDEDFERREANHMRYGKIALYPTAQEELSMGGIKDMLYDCSNSTDGGDVVDLYPRRKQVSKRSRLEFPNAKALADEYDSFDVMDFDRPSLKARAKGRKGKPTFRISDPELDASMELTWEKDRSKKKKRKEERESLRVRGLLGNNNKEDIDAKYKEGIHTIKDELKKFLMSSDAILALPPMHKANRKVVHEFASAFNLKSKSSGHGNKRFPVLYRTSRSLPYAENTFAILEARLKRRYLPRLNMKGKNSAKQPSRAGPSNDTTSYRDGDVVGASAPELGVENRGRAMLEKMGWSIGTGLGAANNKGILLPVTHIVKTTKAGLG